MEKMEIEKPKGSTRIILEMQMVKVGNLEFGYWKAKILKNKMRFNSKNGSEN